MSDIWEEILYTASYAGIPIDLLLVRDELNRAIAVHEFPVTDGGLLQDMGERVRRTTCRIIFFEKSRSLEEAEGAAAVEAGNHVTRFEAFLEAARSPESLEFIHPITGSYLAKVGDLSFSAAATERDTIMVDCAFYEDAVEPSAIVNAKNLGSFSTRNNVAVTIDDLNDSIAAEGVELNDASIPGDAMAAVDAWESADTSVRVVNQEMGRLSSRISSETESLRLASDISTYGTYRQFMRLHNALVLAAETARSSKSSVSQVTIIAGQPLRTLLARIYGASEGNNRYDEVIDLNDIRDPSYIESGTVIRYHVPELGQKKGLRRVAK